ncbi:carbohydrate esterase family 10 protein [Ceratobasidium sp. AG-Ba]|nr:carbohydrate esterase family 10 protein [Ceratobasidium sp. AG-Ba]
MTTISDLTRTEPFKTFFVCYKLGYIVLMLPFRVLFYARRANRQRQSWSLKKSVIISSLTGITDITVRIGYFLGRNVNEEVPAHECKDARFIWVDPVSPKLIQGQLKKFAEACHAQSIRIPAYGFGDWNVEPRGEPLAKDGERIVLHFHGGAYVFGTAHPEDMTANISRGLIEWGSGVVSRTLSVDYRLSSSAPFTVSGPFPSALIDALAGYVYLVRKLGFKPQNIIVAGDSAGGNLALAFVRYLRDTPELGLGMPGGLLLFSPWCDPVGTHEGEAVEKARSNVGVDYIKPRSDSPHSVELYALRSFLGGVSCEEAATNPYISPGSLKLDPSTIGGLFAGFPPTYILSGEAELLVDEIRTLRRRMEADLSKEKLVFDEVLDAVHDFSVFPFWEPERSSAFQRIASWIQKL